MAVITVSREFGSQGDDVAAGVAQRLGLRLVGAEIINQAARQAGVPEVALAEIDELGLLGVRPSRSARHQYRAAVQQVIGQLAAGGDVLLVGRGGQVVLAGQPGVLHVRLMAPLPFRIARVESRGQVPREAATALVMARDRAQASYMKRNFHVRGDDPGLYHVTLNMAHLPVAAAIDIVCRAAAAIAPA